jgi:hypothetical protein
MISVDDIIYIENKSIKDLQFLRFAQQIRLVDVPKKLPYYTLTESK